MHLNLTLSRYDKTALRFPLGRVAPKDRAPKHDRNGDGKVLSDEIPIAVRASYMEFDSNEDGQITADEAKQVETRMLRKQDYQW